MSEPEVSAAETSPGLYEFRHLTPFNHRQAWTVELSPDGNKQALTINNHETVWLSRAPEKARFNRAASQVWYVQKLIHQGTIEVSKKKAHSLLEHLPYELDNESLITPWVESSLKELNSAVEEAAQRRAEERVIRAAGHIAARESLWIVTKSKPEEDEDTLSQRPVLVVGLARLVGLTLDTSSPHTTQVRPVVRGKNEKLGMLRTRTPEPLKSLRPRILDVLEGTPPPTSL